MQYIRDNSSRSLINPWISIWLAPQKTAAWARDNHPLYGVVILLVLHVVVTLVGFAIDSPEPSASRPPPDSKHKFGLYLDIWVMPIIMIFFVYWTSCLYNRSVSLENILWVMVWSLLPMILLSLISMPMEIAGMKISEPLFANKLTTIDGQLAMDPPIPRINTDGAIYFAISTVFILWSFQILLSGVAVVTSVSVKKALWILTLAMIALMLIRLPFTIILGDRDLLDVLGLNGILEP